MLNQITHSQNNHLLQLQILPWSRVYQFYTNKSLLENLSNGTYMMNLPPMNILQVCSEDQTTQDIAEALSNAIIQCCNYSFPPTVPSVIKNM